MESLEHLTVDETALTARDTIIRMGYGPVWLYPSCGISNLYVEGGVRTSPAGEGWFQFENLRALHETIADHFLGLKSPMQGEVFRFLRKEMLLTAREAALLTGIAYEAVIAWENGGFSCADGEKEIRALYAAWRKTNIRPAVPMDKAATA